MTTGPPQKGDDEAAGADPMAPGRSLDDDSRDDVEPNEPA
jgi:hypothetical protein